MALAKRAFIAGGSITSFIGKGHPGLHLETTSRFRKETQRGKVFTAGCG